MDFEKLWKFLILFNLLGFALPWISVRISSKTGKRVIDILADIVALVGGSVGVLIAICLSGQRAEKDNMMSRVFVGCVFVLQIVVALAMSGRRAEHITFAFWEFFGEHIIFLWYIVLINLITIVMFAVDKYRAQKGGSRISIVTLLSLTAIGGSLGAIAGMYLFRHKTKKSYFKYGVPMIGVTQAVVVFYLMNMR